MGIKNDYKQYFTPDGLARVMVNLIPDFQPHSIIDLSMGEGCLLKAARERWTSAQLYGVDIDSKLCSRPEASRDIASFCTDSLSDDLNIWKDFDEVIKQGGFDLAIANPPFDYRNQQRESFGNIQGSFTIEIRFLIKYLEIVKSGGIICIVLPYSVLCAENLQTFRTELANEVDILKIAKVFSRCFENVDVDLCIMVLKKKNSFEDHNDRQNTPFYYVDSNYEIRQSVVGITAMDERWDIEYYSQGTDRQSVNNQFEKNKLSQFVSELKRGKTIAGIDISNADNGKKYIHTTDVKVLYISPKKIRRLNSQQCRNVLGSTVLKKNQLIVGRVGRGCIGKVAVVGYQYSGSYFSDCLFALTLKNIDPYYLALYFASNIGRRQLISATIGSCGKYITQKALLNVDVFCPSMSKQKQYSDEVKTILSKRGRTNKEKLFLELVEQFNYDLVKG